MSLIDDATGELSLIKLVDWYGQTEDTELYVTSENVPAL